MIWLHWLIAASLIGAAWCALAIITAIAHHLVRSACKRRYCEQNRRQR